MRPFTEQQNRALRCSVLNPSSVRRRGPRAYHNFAPLRESLGIGLPAVAIDCCRRFAALRDSRFANCGLTPAAKCYRHSAAFHFGKTNVQTHLVQCLQLDEEAFGRMVNSRKDAAIHRTTEPCPPLLRVKSENRPPPRSKRVSQLSAFVSLCETLRILLTGRRDRLLPPLRGSS